MTAISNHYFPESAITYNLSNDQLDAQTYSSRGKVIANHLDSRLEISDIYKGSLLVKSSLLETNNTVIKRYGDGFCVNNGTLLIFFITEDSIVSTSQFESAISSTCDNLVHSIARASKERDGSRIMIFEIEKILRDGNLNLLNGVLMNIDMHAISVRSIGVLFRSAYRVKEQLSSWNIAFKRAQRVIELQGKSPQEVFRGFVV